MGSPRKGTRRRLFSPGNAFQRLWWGIPPRKSSRIRLLLLGSAFQRPGQGVPPGTALEQDRSYQEMPSRGFLAKVSPRKGSRTRSLLPGSAFKRLWSEGPCREEGRARTKALRSRQNEKALGGTPLGLSGSLGPFHVSSGSSLGSLEFPPPICFQGNGNKLTLVEVHRDKFQSP